MLALSLVGASTGVVAQSKTGGKKKTQKSKQSQGKKSGTGTGKKTTTQSSTKQGTGGQTGSAKEQKGPSTPATGEKPVDYGALPTAKLFNGKDLTGWHLRHTDGKNAWTTDNGILANTDRGTDLVSDAKFGDFELHVEVNVPQGGNSGVYLQGRYEIQIGDTAGATELTNSMMGAVYSKLAPLTNAAKPAGQWQTLDVHFLQALRDKSGAIIAKPMVTIILNDELIADRAEIDGVTGGALDNEEGTPGPIMLQGDHTAVQYRNLIIRQLPARKPPAEEPEEESSPPPNGK